MKKQSNVTYILRLSLTLLIITGVMAALLSVVNGITEEKIAAITEEKTQKAIEEVLPNAGDIVQVDFTDESGLVRTVYSSTTYTSSGMLEPLADARVDYAVEVVPSGFNGEITMMVGVDCDGNVTGISIIDHTETAGLGAVAAADNAKGQAFRAQFVGLGGELAVTKDGGEIDALTSATITSRAVVEGVNAAVACVEKLVQEG